MSKKTIKIIYGRPQVLTYNGITSGTVACNDRTDGSVYMARGNCKTYPRHYLTRNMYLNDNFSRITNDLNYYNAVGDDNFALAYGSAGARVEQLKQALRVLGASIDEENFGNQTKAALLRFGYPAAILDEKKFNEIILRAYDFGGKKVITLTEPQMRALYEREVPLSKREKLTFEKWLNRQKLKSKIGAGGKQVFDVLLGWLQIKAKGFGDTSGLPAAQPTPTQGGGFFTSREGEMPPAVWVIGGALLLGFGAWGISTMIKRNQ